MLKIYSSIVKNKNTLITYLIHKIQMTIVRNSKSRATISRCSVFKVKSKSLINILLSLMISDETLFNIHLFPLFAS